MSLPFFESLIHMNQAFLWNKKKEIGRLCNVNMGLMYRVTASLNHVFFIQKESKI